MKYSKSCDGIERTSFRVEVRLTQFEVDRIRAYLDSKGLNSSDRAISAFVSSCTEYTPASCLLSADEFDALVREGRDY